MDFLVISTGRNCGVAARRCAQSVRMQEVDADIYHIYIDAKSDDDTYKQAKDGGAVLVSRDAPMLANLRWAVDKLALKHTIIVSLDGDDWLEPDALTRVALEYQQTNCQMTYGQFRFPNGAAGWASKYSDEVVKYQLYRSDRWRATHLKTYRADLFKRVNVEELFSKHTGQYFELATDLAVMFPMLEMAGHRARFIPDELYVYNYNHSWQKKATPEDFVREAEVVREIRHRTPYTTRMT